MIACLLHEIVYIKVVCPQLTAQWILLPKTVIVDEGTQNIFHRAFHGWPSMKPRSLEDDWRVAGRLWRARHGGFYGRWPTVYLVALDRTCHRCCSLSVQAVATKRHRCATDSDRLGCGRVEQRGSLVYAFVYTLYQMIGQRTSCGRPPVLFIKME